jgi:hypothetical protein
MADNASAVSVVEPAGTPVILPPSNAVAGFLVASVRLVNVQAQKIVRHPRLEIPNAPDLSRRLLVEEVERDVQD